LFQIVTIKYWIY